MLIILRVIPLLRNINVNVTVTDPFTMTDQAKLRELLALNNKVTRLINELLADATPVVTEQKTLHEALSDFIEQKPPEVLPITPLQKTDLWEYRDETDGRNWGCYWFTPTALAEEAVKRGATGATPNEVGRYLRGLGFVCETKRYGAKSGWGSAMARLYFLRVVEEYEEF